MPNQPLKASWLGADLMPFFDTRPTADAPFVHLHALDWGDSFQLEYLSTRFFNADEKSLFP